MKAKLGKTVGAGALVLMMTICFMPAMAGAFAPGGGTPGKDFGPHGHQPPALGIWRNPQVIEKLKLTEAQVKQIRDLDFSSREKILPLKAQIDACRLKMDKAISEDNVDQKIVLTQAKKIADLRGKIFIRKIEARLAFKEILTADQLNELKLLFEHRKRWRPETGRNFLPGGYTQGERDPEKASAF